MQIIISVIAGFCISFIGALPLGNLNVTAMKLATAGRLQEAYQFSIGVVVVEMIYMLLCLQGVNLAANYAGIYLVLQCAMVLLLVAIGVNCFVNASKAKGNVTATKTIGQSKNGYIAGAAMSAVNVLQIPYWTGWITVAKQNAWLTKNTTYFFTVAAGAGTFLSMIIFIKAGQKLSWWLIKNTRVIDTILGVLFLLAALSQVYHIYKND